MTQATRPATPLSPVERYIRILWDARLPFVVITMLFVMAAATVTVFQPTLYVSRALLGVKPSSIVLSPAAAEAVRTGRIRIGDDGRVYDETDPERQSGPGRYAPRLRASGFVTEAAHDAGVLTADRSLDDKQAAAWVDAEAIERSDLIALTVWQPTPDAAQKLAAKLVERALDMNRREEASRPAQFRRELTRVDPPTRPSAPAYPRWSLNLSVGFVLGLLTATVFVVGRAIVRRP